MANRYGRDIGRRGDYGRSRSSAYGSTPFGEDERYFGGSRSYGEGYTGRSDYDTYERDYGRIPERDRSEDYGERYETGRYRPDTEYSQGYRGESRRSYPRRGYQGRGYGNYGSTRFEERFGGQGAEDFARYSPNYPTYGPSYGAYGPSYPASERGYMRDYDEDEERGWWDKTSDEVASWFGDEEAARRRRMDTWGGGHRGRGPSGYTRSDERIKEDINDRLTDYDYIDATNITVEVTGGEATLSGTVSSRYEKRLAEDIAEDVSGVGNVENRIRVSETWRETSPQTTTTAGRSKGATGS